MEIGYYCIYSNSMDIIFNKYIKHKSNNNILKEIIDFFFLWRMRRTPFWKYFYSSEISSFYSVFGVRPDFLWDTNKSQGVLRDAFLWFWYPWDSLRFVWVSLAFLGGLFGYLLVFFGFHGVLRMSQRYECVPNMF